MSNFKVGDKVVLSSKTYQMGDDGDTAKINKDYGDGLYRVEMISGKSNGKTCVKFSREFKKAESNYQLSNRYKLKKLIEETKYSSRRLSDIAVGNESFFYNQTGEARFNKKGDISNELFESLKETVKQAQTKLSNKMADALIKEREELGLKPKTVDENNVPIIDKQTNTTDENELKKVDSDLNDIAKDLWNDENHVIAILNQVPPKNYGYALFCIAWVITVFIGFIGFLCWLAVK